MKTLTRRQTLGGMALLLAAAVTACGQDKPQFKSIDITGADYAHDFSLPDQNGQQRTLADFKGKIVVLFFGYTQCPDVCPTTMAELAEIRKQLGAEGNRLQVLFVTVDPERDTAELLKAYMTGFDPSFIALRPTPAELPELAKRFKIYYKKVEGRTDGSYTMDHSAGSYVYDSAGRLRLFTRYGAGPAPLLDDIRLLLKSSQT